MMTNTTIRLIEPVVITEAKDVIDELKQGNVTIVNLTKIDQNLRHRIFDFLGGAVYALDAQLELISKDTYLCVPQGVVIDGQFEEE